MFCVRKIKTSWYLIILSDLLNILILKQHSAAEFPVTTASKTASNNISLKGLDPKGIFVKKLFSYISNEHVNYQLSEQFEECFWRQTIWSHYEYKRKYVPDT